MLLPQYPKERLCRGRQKVIPATVHNEESRATVSAEKGLILCRDPSVQSRCQGTCPWDLEDLLAQAQVEQFTASVYRQSRTALSASLRRQLLNKEIQLLTGQTVGGGYSRLL